jgi:hypothetical protein
LVNKSRQVLSAAINSRRVVAPAKLRGGAASGSAR